MIKKVVLKQPEPPADPVPVEVIASAILSISEGVKKLREGPLNDKALVMLIQNASPGIKGARGYVVDRVTAKQVWAVLEGMESLRDEYLKPKAKP